MADRQRPYGHIRPHTGLQASDGSYAFIYTATGAKLEIRMVDRIYEKLSGNRIKAYWYDPRLGTSGIYRRVSKTESRTFTPPSSGRGNDWVLCSMTRLGTPGPRHRRQINV